tara:strand:+ start:275 stop:379 length:105 start_codon:yes stop_codon:yes gene_type:complete
MYFKLNNMENTETHNRIAKLLFLGMIMVFIANNI